MMRSIGFLFLLTGVGLIFGYPFYVANHTNYAIGSYPIYDAATGFSDVENLPLKAVDAPLAIRFDALATYDNARLGNAANFTFVINGDNGSIAAEVVELTAQRVQSGEAGFQMSGSVAKVTSIDNGLYTFNFGEGDRQDIVVDRIEMVLTGNAISGQNPYQQIGYGLIIAGAFSMLFLGRRKRTPREPQKQSRSKTSQIGRRVPVEAAPKAEPEKKAPARQWGRGDDNA